MANANNVKRIIVENGIILSKILKKATNEFKGQDGNIVPAQPERYVLKVASSFKIDQETGFEDVTILDYKVDESLFNTMKFMDKVEVTYEFSTYKLTAISVKPIQK